MTSFLSHTSPFLLIHFTTHSFDISDFQQSPTKLNLQFYQNPKPTNLEPLNFLSH